MCIVCNVVATLAFTAVCADGVRLFAFPLFDAAFAAVVIASALSPRARWLGMAVVSRL